MLSVHVWFTRSLALGSCRLCGCRYTSSSAWFPSLSILIPTPNWQQFSILCFVMVACCAAYDSQEEDMYGQLPCQLEDSFCSEPCCVLVDGEVRSEAGDLAVEDVRGFLVQCAPGRSLLLAVVVC